MKLIIFGANGQVGTHLINLFSKSQHSTLSFSHRELDITNLTDLEKLKEKNPHLLINASAYTAVELAENKKEQAFRVNDKGVHNLVMLAKALNIPLIHLSTDYVFDGKSLKPYIETDVRRPLNIYGQSKLAGEQKISSLLTEYITLRTSWVFSEYGNNFLKTMLQLKDKEMLSIVSDQRGKPTYAGDIANVILKMVNIIEKKNNLHWGTYHYSGDSEVSWFEFAQYIFHYLKKIGHNTPQLNSINSSEYPTLAKRPLLSNLDNTKIQNEFKIHSSNWKKAVAQCINKL